MNQKREFEIIQSYWSNCSKFGPFSIFSCGWGDFLDQAYRHQINLNPDTGEIHFPECCSTVFIQNPNQYIQLPSGGNILSGQEWDRFLIGIITGISSATFENIYKPEQFWNFKGNFNLLVSKALQTGNLNRLDGIRNILDQAVNNAFAKHLNFAIIEP